MIVKNDSTVLLRDVQVEHYRDVLFYICDDIHRSIRLTSYMKNELTNIFGKHNTRFKGEYYYYVWIVNFKGSVFNIYTNANKGTTFALVLSDCNEDKSELCIEFLTEIDNILINIENGSKNI